MSAVDARQRTGTTVVCSHSGCGAIKAMLATAEQPQPLPSLEAWLTVNDVRPLLDSFAPSLTTDEVAKLVARAQIERLETYPLVAEATKEGRLSLSAWFFDVRSGQLEEWSKAGQRFIGVGDERDGPRDDEDIVDVALPVRPRPAT